MINESPADTNRSFGLLQLRGADVHKFLQGQLSNDMSLLAAERFTLAGYHNPQGRVLALLRLCAPEPDQVLALLPAELAEPTMTELRRFVLRAKVTISQETSAAAIAAMARQWPALASLLDPSAHALEVAAGIPQVYGATRAMFVSQMLNLDCIEAISFTKGCYTGQEIIARAHYRGRIKRRMQRFLTESIRELSPGQGVTLNDGRAAQVVDTIRRADGRREFLAVTTLPAHIAPVDQATPAPSQQSSQTLACSPLPLPYALPE